MTFNLPEACSNEYFFEKWPRDASMTSCPCWLLTSVEIVEGNMWLLQGFSLTNSQRVLKKGPQSCAE